MERPHYAPIIKGEFNLKVFRADGRVEELGPYPNILTTQGQNYIAQLQSTAPDSVVNHMAVGTATIAATYTSVVLSLGEVDRNTMATRTAAANVLSEVCTFAGFLDSVKSLQIRAIGCSNHAGSGQGILRSLTVLGTAVVMADSDFLLVNYTNTTS